MPYASQYLKYVEAEIPVSRTLIRPRNIYKIKSYKDVDNKTHTYAGNNSAIVFVIGIFDKKVWCIRMTDIRPVFFWNWLTPMIKKGVVLNEKIKKLEDLLVSDTKNGKKIFGNFVKGKKVYNLEPAVFRTYNLPGINSVEELKIDLNFLKTQYKLESEEVKSEYNDPKVEANKTDRVKAQEQKLKDNNSNSTKPDSKEGKSTQIETIKS